MRSAAILSLLESVGSITAKSMTAMADSADGLKP
jgi:hypothetical protein